MGAKLQPGTGGNIYVPYEERAGNESIVYFTRDFSAAIGYFVSAICG